MITQQYYANSVQGGGSIASKERKYTLKFPEGVTPYKLTTEKTNVFDIIPFNVTNENHPLVVGGHIKADGSVQDDIFTYYEHRNINENGDSCICNKKTFGKKCPICEERDRRIKAAGGWNALTEEQKDEMKALAPKARVIMNVIDWNDRNGGIKVFSGSEYIIRQGILGNSSVNRDDAYDKNHALLTNCDTFEIDNYDWKTKQTTKVEYINFSSPISGFGIAIKCKPATFNGNSFAKPVDFSLVPRQSQYSKDIVDSTIDLSTFLVPMTYAQVEELFYGISKDEEEVIDTNASVGIDADEYRRQAEKATAEWNAEKKPTYHSDMSNAPVSPVETPVAQTTEYAQTVQASAQPIGVAPNSTPATAPLNVETVQKCSYGHIIGKDWESSDDCSACLENNQAQYIACNKLRKASN